MNEPYRKRKSVRRVIEANADMREGRRASTVTVSCRGDLCAIYVDGDRWPHFTERQARRLVSAIQTVLDEMEARKRYVKSLSISKRP